MKKILLLIPILLVLAALPSCTGGDVMADYHITNVTELQAMSPGHLADDCILDNDIDATGVAFTPVGTNAAPFTGSFDGQNHTITGLGVNTPATDFAGLFGKIDSVKEIKNVYIENCNIIGQDYVGGLAGWNSNAPVSNCHVQGRIESADHAAASIYGIGGLIGFVSKGTTTNCDFEGELITGDAPGVGKDIASVAGLIGENAGGVVSGCYAKADLTIGTPQDDTAWLGGLIGLNYFFGGIAANISNCYFEGEIRLAGGGAHASASIVDIGGLIGWNDDLCNVSDSYAIADIYFGPVQYSFYNGGLIGCCDKDLTISNCYSRGSLNFEGALPQGLAQTAGLNGYNEASIVDSYSRVEINVTALVRDIDDMGGFVGVNSDWGGGQTIVRCSSHGNINIGNVTNDVEWTGGFIGWNDDNCPITDCYAKGNLSVGNIGGNADRLGGFIGYNCANCPASNCYSSGSINWGTLGGAATNIGGLMGDNDSLATTTNSFWDTESSGQATSAGGTGKTTAQMNARSTFTDAGWDFDAVWSICDPPQPCYPWLQWENIQCLGVIISLIG